MESLCDIINFLMRDASRTFEINCTVHRKEGKECFLYCERKLLIVKCTMLDAPLVGVLHLSIIIIIPFLSTVYPLYNDTP